MSAPATALETGGQTAKLALRDVLGEIAWQRLPAAVRVRFGEPVLAVDYAGKFDVVRASLLGRLIAWVCQAIGTPVVPRTGEDIPAVIHVGPVKRGASWLREYHWPDGGTCEVHSTKAVGPDGVLVEDLPAGLRMRFTVTVTHPLFGEVFYQTGRFRAAGGRS